ncbi:MAG TPA: pyruvate dehydrogenase (acetyl-transferring) E1 component subunit alpha [Candidatus Acidoferrum sp.]|nr:pyruvate dehydrogenase (acetyl-transferring) E1 component subunit alpha [Candidatus Acidoferrum sp.]
MQKRVYDGKVDYLQIMDEQGNIDQQLFPKEVDDNKIIEMYKWMSFARALDAKALSLQRQGRAVTYAPLIGEEATQIGSALAMGPKDFFVPNFRQHGVFLVRGLPLDAFFIYWKGYEEGSTIGKDVNAVPYIVPVATQLPHATGIAFAQKYRNTGGTVVTYVGDGGTSEGNFYEAINFAGVMKVPLVVIIENNGWAISEPRSKQSIAQTLAQKAIAAGIPSMQVDGNDVVAVYKATRDAIANSKAGPTVIECLTYRMSMHTTADDPGKYRSDADVEAWKAKDPILRVRAYLNRKKLWDDAKEAAMAAEQLKQIDAAVEKAESFNADPKSMFQNVYSFIPDTLKDEMDAAIAAGYWQQGK